MKLRSEAWESVPGWFDWHDCIAQAVADARDGAHFVEVGVYCGKSTVFFAEEIRRSEKRIRLDSWDIFEGWHPWDPNVPVPTIDVVRGHLGPELLQIANVRQGRSPDVAAQYEDRSLDFVWIDGGHHEEECAADILGWWPKLKLGGVMGGHDLTPKFGGVVAAVARLLGPRASSRPPWSWWAPKTDLGPIG